jgi:hypothetical protein
MLEGIVLTNEVDCFDLCEILRLKLTGYVDSLNLHILNDNSGSLIGCVCR